MTGLERTAEELLTEAREQITEIPPSEAMARHGDDDVVFLDVRNEVELREDGLIPGAAHVPRGMIEFKADPTSDHHEPVFTPDAEYVCYCVLGIRSAFVTDRLQGMGYDVVNLEGGIDAWQAQGGDVVPYEDATD